MKTVCIIPARGGSKRIPSKNIIDFNGKPMISWTIEAAQKSGIFDEIFVSTDDEKIAEVARKCGVAVPFLRNEKSDDFSSVSEATISALKQIKQHSGNEFDVVVQLMANCPIRDENDIRESYSHFLSKNLDYQVSCFRFGWMNPWWASRLDEEGRPISIFPDDSGKKRSQDLPKLYCPTGAIWIAKTQKLIQANSFYGPDVRFHEISWTSAVDIDDYDDLNFALAAAHMKNASVKTSVKP